MTMASDRGRISSIDTMRVMAILGVIAIHAHPLANVRLGSSPVSVGDCLDFAGRFAVPFFLAAAGYFLAGRAGSAAPTNAALKKLTLRLLAIIGFWYGLYLLLPSDWESVRTHGYLRVVAWNSAGLLEHPSRWLTGPRGHLWFLPALLLGTLHVALAQRLLKHFAVVYLAALYLFNLAHGPYAAILGTTPTPIPGGLTGTPLAIFLGMGLVDQRYRFSARQALLILVAGVLSMIGEASWLWHAHRVPVQGHDFLLGTPLLVVGLLGSCLAAPAWSSRTPLPGWGRYTLGVYGIHVAVIEFLDARATGPLPWELSKTFIIYAISLGIVWCLTRVPGLRRLLT